MYYLFFLLFLFVLEYISVHHNLPVVHNVLSLKYLFLYQILKWERIIPPTATDSYEKTYVSRYNRLPTFAIQVSQGNLKVLSRRIALPRMKRPITDIDISDNGQSIDICLYLFSFKCFT